MSTNEPATNPLTDMARARFALAAQVGHLTMTMTLALRALDAADITSPDARRLVGEARRIMRLALAAEADDGRAQDLRRATDER